MSKSWTSWRTTRVSMEEAGFFAEAEAEIEEDRVRQLTAALGLPGEAAPAVRELLLGPGDSDLVAELFCELREVVLLMRSPEDPEPPTSRGRPRLTWPGVKP